MKTTAALTSSTADDASLTWASSYPIEGAEESKMKNTRATSLALASRRRKCLDVKSAGKLAARRLHTHCRLGSEHLVATSFIAPMNSLPHLAARPFYLAASLIRFPGRGFAPSSVVRPSPSKSEANELQHLVPEYCE